MKALVFLFLASCAVDAADGQAQDPEDCCWLWPFEDEVLECVSASIVDWDAYARDAKGCVQVTCHPSTIRWQGTACPGDER